MGNGQAGLASDFGNMCNMRMAPNGVFTHVLPLTAAHGATWRPWRVELEKDFQDIVAIANVATGELQSMSADTGMSEMLVVATKRQQRPISGGGPRRFYASISMPPLLPWPRATP